MIVSRQGHINEQSMDSNNTTGQSQKPRYSNSPIPTVRGFVLLDSFVLLHSFFLSFVPSGFALDSSVLSAHSTYFSATTTSSQPPAQDKMRANHLSSLSTAPLYRPLSRYTLGLHLYVYHMYLSSRPVR